MKSFSENDLAIIKEYENLKKIREEKENKYSSELKKYGNDLTSKQKIILNKLEIDALEAQKICQDFFRVNQNSLLLDKND